MGLTRRGFLGATVSTAALLGLSACGASTDSAEGSGRGWRRRQIVLGFAQVGAESGWRTANTKSDPGRGQGGRASISSSPTRSRSRRTRSRRSAPTSSRRST